MTGEPAGEFATAALAAVTADRAGPRARLLVETIAAVPRQGQPGACPADRFARLGLHPLAAAGDEARPAWDGWAIEIPSPGSIRVTGPGLTLFAGTLMIPPAWLAAAFARHGADLLTGIQGLSQPGRATATLIADAAHAGRLAGARVPVVIGTLARTPGDARAG